MTPEHKEKLRLARVAAKARRDAEKIAKPSEIVAKEINDLAEQMKVSDIAKEMKERAEQGNPIKRIEELEEVVQRLNEEIKKKQAPKKSSDVPVPPSWMNIMYDILDDRFSMTVDEGVGGNFVMKIYLPQELKRDKTIVGDDISSGLIRRESAPDDVENWCKKIRDNIKKTHPSFKS